MKEKVFLDAFVSKSQRILYPTLSFKIASYLAIAALLIFGGALVILTGGTQFSYLHLMYVPIILAGFLFGIPGGLVVAILASIILGPFMPSNIEQGLPQPVSSWVIRALFFCGVGVFSGIGSSLFRSYIRELEEKFTVDPLTKLPNMGGLLSHFSEAIVPTNKSTYVMLIEICYLDEIDRAFGPEGRGALLQHVRDCLKTALSSKVKIGFVDTKTFCALVPTHFDIQEVLPRIQQELSKSFLIDNIPIFVETRYGICKFPDDGIDLPTLIRKSKIAISNSEETGRQQAFFDREESSKIQKNIKILHTLRQSIENKLMGLHYQPKVDLKSKKPMGFEALARWSHPSLGRVSPEEFIPLTERTLLINPFTEWVLEEAISQGKKWHDEGFKQQISVNFSMKNFLNAEAVNMVLETLKKYKFPPSFLEVEITETAIAQNISAASDLMHTLRENGVKIAVDDFGTGQSSLQYLFKLPLDILKIDRLFVSEMTSNAGAAAIVQSAIKLGHELNLQVIAEGVETQEEMDLLTKYGCDGVQGYLLAAPMEVHQATDWLYSSMSVRPPSKGAVRTVP